MMRPRPADHYESQVFFEEDTAGDRGKGDAYGAQVP